MSNPRKRRRSFSQWSDWQRCPRMFELKRIEKRPQKQAAWSPMGTAIHAAIERWEKSDRRMPVEEVQARFRGVYGYEIDQQKEVEPNLDRWFPSGPYHAEDDIPRRQEIGEEHVAGVLGWYEKNPGEQPWRLIDGRLAVELRFWLQLGSSRVIGFGDVVIRYPTGELLPRDYKSGRSDGDPMQLKLLAIAVEDYLEHHGEPTRVAAGDFFKTRNAAPQKRPHRMDEWSRDDLVVEFEKLDHEIGGGRFPANPGDHCRFCSVRDWCDEKTV